MINIRLATEEDKEEWNKVVEQSDNGTIYHTWEWKQVIEQGLGDKGYYIIAERNNDLVGVFPLFSRASLKYSKLPVPIKDYFKVFWSPHPQTWGYGGPCFLETNDEIRKRMLNAIDTFVRGDRKVLSLRIFPYKNEIAQHLSKNGFREITWQTAYLDLSVNTNDLWSSFKKSFRRRVKKSECHGMEVVQATKLSEVKEFYDNVWTEFGTYLKSKSKTQYVFSPVFINWGYFKCIFDILVPKKLAKFYFAVYEDQIVSGTILLYYKNIVFRLHSATNRKYLDIYPNHLLYWATISDAKDEDYEIYDQAGLPLDKNDSVYIFKSQLNGKLVKLNWYYKEYRLEGIRNVKKKIFR